MNSSMIIACIVLYAGMWTAYLLLCRISNKIEREEKQYHQKVSGVENE